MLGIEFEVEVVHDMDVGLISSVGSCGWILIEFWWRRAQYGAHSLECVREIWKVIYGLWQSKNNMKKRVS